MACSGPGRPGRGRQPGLHLPRPSEGAGQACGFPLLEPEAKALPTRVAAPQVRAFLQPPLKGVVMETFGSGNGPTKPDLLRELQAAAERGLVIVNCSHCLQGSVTSDYAAGMVGAGNWALEGEGTGPVTLHPNSCLHPFPHRPWQERALSLAST